MLGTMDVYSDTIRAIYRRYSDDDYTLFLDWEILLDYRTVTQARMTDMSDDAKQMADQLDKVLEEEISSRMNRWRVQAKAMTTRFYNELTSYQ